MYERVWLVVVNFQKNPPKLYSDIEDLVQDGLIRQGTTASLKKMSIEGFVKDLLEVYKKRFTMSNLI